MMQSKPKQSILRIETVLTLAEDVYHMAEKNYKFSSEVRVLLVAGRVVTMARTAVVLFTVYCLLLMGTVSEKQTCTVRGQTGFMEFSKEGDLIIGGVFSITSTRVIVDNDYQAIPSTYCKR